MTLIRVNISSDAAQVVSRLRAFPPAMLAAIARAMDAENQFSITHMVTKKLRGPRPQFLGVGRGKLGGRLRNSINASPAKVSADSVTSAIGTNVVYAGVHEFGFDGQVQVPAHSRRIVRTTQGTARLNKQGRIVRSKPKKTQTGTAQVRAHTRHMRMPERSYLRSTINERKDDYSAAVSDAIVAAWTGGSK